MSRETPEEVREFAEACGWKLLPPTEHRQEIWTHPVKAWLSSYKLPDFLHDLNACFEALEWFCQKHSGGNYQITSGYSVAIPTGSDDDFEMFDGEGATIQAAIIRAVNAAAKARKE